ncbi:Ribosomal protein L29 [Halanaeroarchaeum sp. HSR-CO]|uniref:50S ribosomal protein L29 n=1 Tax=Halanaeroarchaeum sp. HSR-CO TaxID=2866382 RepID=UPI0037C0072B|nr:Ribosomal protein L29 [Halanaeroarchaeum sp. HSR-CO]
MILHPEELRDMTPAERQAELEEIETELLNDRAVKAAGGAPENPGRIGELRRTIARIKTIQTEEGDPAEAASGSPSDEEDESAATEEQQAETDE